MMISVKSNVFSSLATSCSIANRPHNVMTLIYENMTLKITLESLATPKTPLLTHRKALQKIITLKILSH